MSRIIRLEKLAAINPEAERERGYELLARFATIIDGMREAEAAEEKAKVATLDKAN
jgi:hypothetical protein